MKKTIQNTLIFFVSLAVVLGIAETVTRLEGYKTWNPSAFQMDNIRMEPKALFTPDSLVGYKTDSGVYKVYYEDNTYWQATHNAKGYRITTFDTALINHPPKNHIDIFGCSFSYGSGLMDTETYAYMLQQFLPAYKINNYSVAGYGTANIYVQLTQQIPIDSGATIIYAYIASHDYKVNNQRFKDMYPSREVVKKYYFLHLEDSFKVVRVQYNYKPLPFTRYSAFLNFLEDKYLAALDDMDSKHRTTRKAISYLNKLCKAKGARFVFAALSDEDYSKDMLLFCSRNNIDHVDLAVNFNNPKYNLLPHDDHPNFEANKLYAQKLYAYLKQMNYVNSK